MQIDHFVLTVKNIEEILSFYKRVLGAELIDYEAWRSGQIRYPSMLFSMQKIILHSDSTKAQPKAKNPTSGSADICFLWEGNISSAIDHLAQHGIPIELGPVERVGTHGKGKSVYFRDPEGNLIELISYLP
ncbi:MAG: biphenyl-2,3-diol 1,2-dioxygenase III-related protein [Ignavibacteriae bacterium]|nr:MAG: biphenyl-2,3-diol 1,2-dioxygenase III-related protein [Ignavibacteriota bacterium]